MAGKRAVLACQLPGFGMNAPALSTRVLIADDYPGAAQSLSDLLSIISQGQIEASVALDGSLAVASALASQADVVILDIEMPVMDGVQAAMAIRAALGADAPLLIALTGNAQRASDLETMCAFDRVLPKPPDLDQILKMLPLMG